MHQQRVLAHINQRKREAMTCYTQALTELPPNVRSLTGSQSSSEISWHLLFHLVLGTSRWKMLAETSSRSSQGSSSCFGSLSPSVELRRHWGTWSSCTRTSTHIGAINWHRSRRQPVNDHAETLPILVEEALTVDGRLHPGTSLKGRNSWIFACNDRRSRVSYLGQIQNWNRT